MLAGAAALDKKAKKQFDATELAKLGARAERAQRMPASVGKGAKMLITHLPVFCPSNHRMSAEGPWSPNPVRRLGMCAGRFASVISIAIRHSI